MVFKVKHLSFTLLTINSPEHELTIGLTHHQINCHIMYLICVMFYVISIVKIVNKNLK